MKWTAFCVILNHGKTGVKCKQMAKTKVGKMLVCNLLLKVKKLTNSKPWINSDNLKKSSWRNRGSVSARFCNKCRPSTWTPHNVLKPKAPLMTMMMRIPEINNNNPRMLWPKMPVTFNSCNNSKNKNLYCYKKKKNLKRKRTRRFDFLRLGKLKLTPKTNISSSFLHKWQRWRASLML